VTSGSWQVLPGAAGLALARTGNRGRAQGKTNDPAAWQALGQRGHLRAMPCATMLRPAASGPDRPGRNRDIASLDMGGHRGHGAAAAYRCPAITIRILISSLGDRGEFVTVTVAAVPAPVRDRFHSLIWAAGDVVIPARVIPADVAHTGFGQHGVDIGAGMIRQDPMTSWPCPAHRLTRLTRPAGAR
jgi:hypothetical protein